MLYVPLWRVFYHEDTKGAKSEHEAFQALLEQCDVEIHQEAEPTAGELQIGEQLRLMHWRERLDRFHLNDDASRDENVESIAGVEGDRACADDVTVPAARGQHPAKLCRVGDRVGRQRGQTGGDHPLQDLDGRVREHGSALTVALNWRPRAWLRVTGEALHVRSWRNQRELEGLPAQRDDTQLQLGVRVIF